MSVRQRLGNAYRRIAAPFGARALDAMLRRGLPEQLAPPLRFLFDGIVPPRAQEVARAIEERRVAFAHRGERFRFVADADGEGRWPEAAPEGELTASWLAHNVSVPPRWGMFLHLAAANARSIFEMGTCIGISGAYLASAPSQPTLLSLEGSSSLASIAERTLAPITNRATILRGSFAKTFPRALALLPSLDLAYVDGHHEEAQTIAYVTALLGKLDDGGLIVLDDISLWSGMRRAWRSVAALNGISVAVDTGRFGLLLRERSATGARYDDLSRYTGWWPVRANRA